MSREMTKNDWNSMAIKVKCPFYVSHSYNRCGSTPSISCEKLPSMDGDVRTQVLFTNKVDRDDYMKKYCTDKFYKCSLCRHITWELEEENENDG